MKAALSTSVCRAQGGWGAEEGSVSALQMLSVLGVTSGHRLVLWE